MRCVVCRKECAADSYYYYFSGKDVCCCSEQCFTSFLVSQKKKEEKIFLYETLYRIFGTRNLPTKIYVEVEKLVKNEEYSYKNLTATAHYLYDIKNIPIYSPTLFYIKENFQEAKEYYQKLEEKNQKAEELLSKQESGKGRFILPNYTKKRKAGLRVNPEDV